MLSFPLFTLKTFQQRSEIFNFAAKRKHSHFLLAESALQLFELPKHFAKIALHRKWSFGALFAAGNGYVMKAFSGLREEECIRILKCEPACGIGAGNDIAVAQLRQDDFERFAESIQNANRILQRHDRCGWRSAVRSFVEDERKLGLRILRMNQKGRAAIHIAAQQSQAFIGSVPRIDHDVVQFVAQEVFDHALETRLDLKKIRENADWRESALHYSRLKKAANRFCRVAMLRDDGFERSFFPQSGGELCPQQIEMTLGSSFFRTFRFDRPAKLTDLFGNSGDALRHGFKLESKLAALSTEGFYLKVRIDDFRVQTLSSAIGAGAALCRLGELVAQARDRRHCVKYSDARFFLLVFQFGQCSGCRCRFLLRQVKFMLGQSKIGCCGFQNLAVGIALRLKRCEPMTSLSEFRFSQSGAGCQLGAAFVVMPA